VITENYCLVCTREEETIMHVLWSFPSASDIWGCSMAKIQKQNSEGGSFFQVFKLSVVTV
jgi:hypothetical protein